MENQEIEKRALELFYSDFGCSQSVIMAYADVLKIEMELAENMASAFGGGMGYAQGTCGAITGAYMVIGLYCGKRYSGNVEKKEKTVAMAQEFLSLFVERNKSSVCHTLVNCDLKGEEGQAYYETRNLKETVCSKCIVDAIRIVNQLMHKC